MRKNTVLLLGVAITIATGAVATARSGESVLRPPLGAATTLDGRPLKVGEVIGHEELIIRDGKVTCRGRTPDIVIHGGIGSMPIEVRVFTNSSCEEMIESISYLPFKAPRPATDGFTIRPSSLIKEAGE